MSRSAPAVDEPVTPLAPEDPRRLGRYELLGRLGAGGMGVVYLGRDTAHDGAGDGAGEAAGRLVAVKVIGAQHAGNPAYRARFLQEAELGRRVASFCTPAVLDVGEGAGRPYFVTEYVAGTPLNRIVSEGNPLPAGEVSALAAGVALALAAIHRAGLVHRDLKPGNVLLSRSGVRVIDFGIARPLDAGAEITQTGEVMGSLGWIAPEQLTGGRLTPAADVFAWGCLVAYAATGRHPFGGHDAATRMYRIVTGEPDLDGLTGTLHAWVAAALAKRPADRPDAGALLTGLTSGTAPVRTATRERFRLPARWRRRRDPRSADGLWSNPRRRGALVAAAAVLVTVGAVAEGASPAQPVGGSPSWLTPAAASEVAPAHQPVPGPVPAHAAVPVPPAGAAPGAPAGKRGTGHPRAKGHGHHGDAGD